MSTTVTDTTPALFRAHLSRLRTRLTAWLLLRGLACWVPLVAAILLADAGLDWLIRFDVYQRAVLLVVMAVAATGLAWWLIVRPMVVRLTDAGLLAQIEQTAGIDRGRVRAAAELSGRAPTADIASPELVRRMIDDGVAELRGRGSRRLLDRRGLITYGLVLLLSVATVGGLAIAATRAGLLPIWFDRNVLLGDSLWPQKTYLEFRGVAEDGSIVVPRGEDLALTVVATDQSVVTPQTVRVEFRPAAGRPTQEMRREAGEFHLTIPPVTPPVEVRAVGGDAVTNWVPVRLVEQPDVATLTMTVTPPDYTGQAEPVALPAGSGPYTLLRGSRLALVGTTNKSITGGRLELSHAKAEGWSSWRDVTPAADSPTSQTSFTVDLVPDDWARLENVLTGQRDFKLRLVFTDELGLSTRSPRAFAIRIQDDAPPRVTAETPGIHALVVPKARVPITASATDDFGITAVRITWRVRGETEADDLTGTFNLPVEPVGPTITGPSDADPNAPVVSTAVTADAAWELETLNLPTGRRLSFFVEAVDNDTLHGPNIGRSREFLVELVTEEQLRADLLRRERENREAFEALLKAEKDLVTETRALSAAWSATSEPPDEAGAADLGQSQRTIARNVEALAVKFADVLLEIDNNRLEAADGPLRVRLKEQVIGPMIEIAGPLAGEAVRRLDVSARLASRTAAGLTGNVSPLGDGPGTEPLPATSLPESTPLPGDDPAGAVPVADPTTPPAALDSSAEQMDKIVTAMEDVLLHMVKAEGYQEAVSLLMEIEKQQSGVLERTRAADRERIKRILEGGGLSPPPK